MQIDIDFEVFKALTALRVSENDSYNSVLRRVLNLPNQNALLAAIDGNNSGPLSKAALGNPPRNALSAWSEGRTWDATHNALFPKGVWFDNIHFPDGTNFRATYKGQTFFAEIKDGRWVGGDGVVRTSPSAAAGAISNTTVNGWRFWFFQMPGEPEWRRMDELKA